MGKRAALQREAEEKVQKDAHTKNEVKKKTKDIIAKMEATKEQDPEYVLSRHYKKEAKAQATAAVIAEIEAEGIKEAIREFRHINPPAFECMIVGCFRTFTVEADLIAHKKTCKGLEDTFDVQEKQRQKELKEKARLEALEKKR